MAKETFYVTTPIYYPNDVPHLGHAYTTIAADVIARWHKVLGNDVFFLTGTDEHGKKLADTAAKAGKKPKAFIDALIPEFKAAWKDLNISYDHFVRTTDKDHEAVVQEILQRCFDNGDIYLGEYEGLYCTSCEAYYTEKDAVDGCCPVHEKPLEQLKEASYFFKLSNYQDFLLQLYEEHPEFISPKNRRQEVINRVKEGLRDFSISRTSFDWGIPLPFDKKHVAYVWFDALLNYVSGVGYREDEKQFKKFWPADVHIIGKDILWFHAVYWPAMLQSAGIDLPKQVFAHGWWTVRSKKMGKSAGNAIKIGQLKNYAGVDSARYFLLRNAPFGDDGDFSEEDLIKRHNTELVNKLGNLVSRVTGVVQQSAANVPSGKVISTYRKHIETLEFDKALNSLFAFIDTLNEFIQEKQLWKNKSEKDFCELVTGLRVVAVLLWPFMPETAEKIAKQFGFKVGAHSLKELEKPLKVVKIQKGQLLFERLDAPKVNKDAPVTEIMTGVGVADFSDWEKLDLRVAEVKSVSAIEGADKLWKLTLDVGELGERTICAGLKEYYSDKKLKGKKIIYFSNLKPRKMKGIESQGMLLAASTKDRKQVVLITPDSSIENGAQIG